MTEQIDNAVIIFIALITFAVVAFVAEKIVELFSRLKR
jgi:hypothetical protein